MKFFEVRGPIDFRLEGGGHALSIRVDRVEPDLTAEAGGATSRVIQIRAPAELADKFGVLGASIETDDSNRIDAALVSASMQSALASLEFKALPVGLIKLHVDVVSQPPIARCDAFKCGARLIIARKTWTLDIQP